MSHVHEFEVQIQGADRIPKANFTLEYDDASEMLNSDLLVRFDGQVSCSFPEQTIRLCAPLRDASLEIVRSLQQQQKLGDAGYILLLNTSRDNEPAEPFAAGKLIQDELVRLLTANGKPPKFRDHPFLTSGFLDEKDRYGQRHLRASAAKSIDKQIREARRHAEVAVLCDVGGLPVTKSVVGAASRYRFDEVFYARGTERKPENIGARPLLIAPEESLDTRRRIAQLLRQGAFDAAAALALPDAGGTSAYTSERWRSWLQDAARVINGNSSGVAERIRNEKLHSRTYEVLAKLMAMRPIVFVAFRVESALRRQDWPTAIRETVTFFEASRLEAFKQFFNDSCIDEWFEYFVPSKARRSVRDRLTPELQKSNRAKLEKKKVIGDLVRLLPDDTRQKLQRLQKATLRLWRFRNVATHGTLTTDMIEQARSKATDVELWNSTLPFFLEGKNTTDVLSMLHVQQPADLYQQLIDAILSDMDEFSFREQERLDKVNVR